MKRRLPLYLLLAGLILVGAFFVRLIGLGQIPLMPEEAALALEAADLAGLGSPFWQGQFEVSAPAYISLTRGFMSLFGATEFIARLLPALFGAGIVALPLLLARTLDWPSRLFASFLLAVSAASLTISRSAGGLAIAVFGLSLALLQSKVQSDGPRRGRILVGIGLGLVLSAGAQGWTGIVGVVLAGIISRFMPGSTAVDQADKGRGMSFLFHWETGLSTALTTILVSTAFGTNIAGLAGVLEAPGRWLLGWTGSQGWPLMTALMVPILYEPLLIIVGGYAAARALRNPEIVERFERQAAYWAMGSLLVYLFYPGRTPADIVWVSLPLTFLCARQIVLFIEGILNLSVPLSSSLLGLVLLIVFAFSYLQLEASAAGFGLASLDREAQLAFSVTALVFAGLLILLFGLGWSWPETLLAVALAVVISLAGLSIAFAWRLNFGQTVPEARELWRRRVTTQHLPLLEDTLAEIAKWSVGREAGLAIEIQGQVPPPPLAWGLRNHRRALRTIEGNAAPVILVPESVAAELSADYLGQAFALWKSWGWQGWFPPDPVGWWLDRQAPVQAERWILYVRTDVAELGGTSPLITEE